MPKVRAKWDGSVDRLDSDESDDTFVPDRDKNLDRARLRRKKKRRSRLEEYDEDPGRDGSRKYRRLAQVLDACTTREAGKTKALLKEFRKNVTRRESELRGFRQVKEREFNKRQEKFAAVVKQLSRQLSGGRLGSLRKENHHLFEQARANTKDHRSLIEQSKLVEKQLKAHKLNLPVSRWKKDEREINELLTCCGRNGEILVGNALAPRSAAVVDLPDASEDDQLAKELFKECEKLLDGETWGDVADDQVRQFSVIARMIPPENAVHNAPYYRYR